MAACRRSLWKLVKGSFSELVCCGRPAVSWRSVLRLDYSAVNLQKRLFTGGNMRKSGKPLLDAKNQAEDGFCRKRNVIILRVNKK